MKKKWYPKFKDLKDYDFTGVVPWGLLDELLTPTKRKKLDKWMWGQTHSVWGYYSYDVLRWVWSQQNRKKERSGYL